MTGTSQDPVVIETELNNVIGGLTREGEIRTGRDSYDRW